MCENSKFFQEKNNTRSSIEVELVGVSEYLHYHIWMINFFESQEGYKSWNETLYQDNQSAINIDKHGQKLWLSFFYQTPIRNNIQSI